MAPISQTRASKRAPATASKPQRTTNRPTAKESSGGSDSDNQASKSRRKRVYDSDALDDESEDENAQGSSRVSTNKKGKRTKASNKSPKKASAAKRPRKKAKASSDAADVDEEDAEIELAEGQKVIGVIVQAPKTGRVPPGQISRNTLNFLTQLKDPDCNDRDWFLRLEPVYRLAEQEWKAFVEAFTDSLAEVDGQIPPLPPKDVIHRIYRDMRFSNDKTPYKTGFSASFSRSGRKGIFAHFRPGDSLIAAGLWCPGRNELETVRSSIKRSPRRLREAIAAPDFIEYFGEPTPRKDGGRRSIFGMEDELKVAPKGVEKNHPDIDLLKCRSFAVSHRFLDSEVLDPDFKEKLASVAKVLRPFVHCLNDMLTISNDDDSDDGEDEDEEGTEVGE
ncbi:hypothetical protein BDN72DRAFT_769846 [Pluteus cervinus]|uniref:Uncharacterized protein n=1 Tax=Pluteus cervinus TaxID=181527 RepID=A0ACD3ARD5_9AGAR|nr:hypothetical protein BDN72DRAFT_769846 [Pluteus cervinus]